jgi:hypothetical protein
MQAQRICNKLQDHVDHIAETLRTGITFEDAGIDHEENGCEPDDMISAFDWLQDALDMEFTISSDGEFLGARILVAFGGPNIWVDTRWNKVEGSWWTDSASAGFFDSMDIHGACAEWFACR